MDGKAKLELLSIVVSLILFADEQVKDYQAVEPEAGVVIVEQVVDGDHLDEKFEAPPRILEASVQFGGSSEMSLNPEAHHPVAA